jgi:hypothetical protein
MNALKHGILSTQVLVRGRFGRENAREFAALHRRFTEELCPVGPLEELLVDQIVTAHWRLRRALMAEAGETALSVDGGQWARSQGVNPQQQWMLWDIQGDPVMQMRRTAFGNRLLVRWLSEVRQAVERDGELTEAAVQKLVARFGGKPNVLTSKMDQLRQRLLQNPDGLEGTDRRAWRKEQALLELNLELSLLERSEVECAEREEQEEEARQAAAVLPAAGTLDKILRYETKLERQLFRAMNQLERLQRRRQGEVIPAPLTVEVTGKETE